MIHSSTKRFPRRAVCLGLVAAACLTTISCGGQRAVPIFGTVASRLEYAEPDYQAGLRAATYEIYWDRLQPGRDRFDEARFDKAREDLSAFRDAGMEIVLDLGLQYPPHWAFDVPNSRYVNQYGDVYVDDRPGANGLNAVFSQAIRELQATYVAHVFEELGDDFLAVRLGWGFYGELSYPAHDYAGRPNAYWAYGDLAQGRTTGLAATLSPNPVPGWIPGETTEDHQSAREFADWYLGAMTDYQLWQIDTVRRHYGGQLAILYPSWGLRPGQLEEAVARDLGGFTSPEQNGEVQRGHDFARHIGAISDRKVIVYTTWLDTPQPLVDDGGDNPASWSPVHYLSSLARDRRPELALWGENTGAGSVPDMDLCFERLEAYELSGLFWAFDEQLHQGTTGLASIGDLASMIAAYEAGR